MWITSYNTTLGDCRQVICVLAGQTFLGISWFATLSIFVCVLHFSLFIAYSLLTFLPFVYCCMCSCKHKEMWAISNHFMHDKLLIGHQISFKACCCMEFLPFFVLELTFGIYKWFLYGSIKGIAVFWNGSIVAHLTLFCKWMIKCTIQQYLYSNTLNIFALSFAMHFGCNLVSLLKVMKSNGQSTDLVLWEQRSYDLGSFFFWWNNLQEVQFHRLASTLERFVATSSICLTGQKIPSIRWV